jgi:hypothetical protein
MSVIEVDQTAMVFGDAKPALKGSGDNKGQVLREVLLILAWPQKADPQRPTL